MRVTIDLMKKSTQIIDLSDVINPRVGDDDLLLPLHIVYGDNQTDMRGKDVEFLSNDTNGNRIYVAGTCNTNTPGDNLYMGNLTFRFPAGTFKADGTYDPDKTMFRIVDKETQKVISSVNIKITVMKNAIEFNFDPDKSSYDSRLENMLHDFHDKGQSILDEIKDLNNQAKSNVSGDTAATANAAKQQANANAGDISDLKGEVTGARGRFADMAGREDAQDIAIDQKESIANANANYAALQQKNAQQDTVIAKKANQGFIINYLSKMSLQPETFENEAALNAKYPDGKAGIFVTADTGHLWIFINNEWKDCGVYQAAGTDEAHQTAFSRDLYSGNLIANASFDTSDLWDIARSDLKEPVFSFLDQTLTLYCSDSPDEGKQVETYAIYSDIATNGNDIISFGAETRISGINYDNKDYAVLEMTFKDANGNVVQSAMLPVPPAQQDGAFHKQVLTKDIPAEATTVRLGVCLYGNGRIEIKKPSAYYNQSVMPFDQVELTDRLRNTHDNLLFGMPAHTWMPVTAANGTVTSSTTYKGKKVTTIDATTSNDFNLIVSDLIPVSPADKLSLLVNAMAKGNCSMEIYQYDSKGANLNSENISLKLLSSDDFNVFYFNNVSLAENAVAVRIHAVAAAGAKLEVQDVQATVGDYTAQSVVEDSYQLQKEDNALADYPVSTWQPNYGDDAEASLDTSTVYRGRPTIKLSKTSQNTSYHTLISPNIPVKQGDKVSLEVIAKASYNRWEGAGSTCFAEIKQLVGNETVDSKIASIFLNNSQDFEKYTINNVEILPDATAVSVDFGFHNSATINVASIRLKVNGEFPEGLQVQHWDPWNQYCSYENGIAKVEATNLTNSDFSFLQSNPIAVDSSKDIDIHIDTNEDDHGIRYLEVHQLKSVFDQLAITPNYFFAKGKTQDFKKISLDSDTKYIVLRLVLQGNGVLTANDLQIKYSTNNNITLSENQYDLPRLTLDVKSNISSEWKVAPFAFQDGNRKVTGYLQYAIQGDSSSLYQKKNLKIKCFSDSECTKKLKWKPKSSWVANNKFNIKANFIDATQARNIVNSHLIRDAISVTSIADNTVADRLYSTQALGQMDGFPIELYFSNGYYGLMTFNLKKDEVVYALNDDQSEAITLETPDSNLDKADDTVDGKKYATVKEDTASDELKNNFKKFLNFINTASDDDFKAQISSYIDVKSVINLYLFGVFSHEWDFTNKSEVLLTYDNGKSYYMMPYDLDSTWGLYWNGQSLNEADNPTNPYGSTSTNKLLTRIFDNFKQEIKDQWNLLRSTVWSNKQILSAYRGFITSIPESSYESDLDRWPEIPSKDITNYEQIQHSVLTRAKLVDNWIKLL
ncbi:CotH kinase family protein [Limosilactobacillus ingluviei]